MLNVVAWEREERGRVGGVANYPELGDFAPKNYYSAKPLGMGAYQGTKNSGANWGSAVGVGNVLFQIQRPEVRFMNV